MLSMFPEMRPKVEAVLAALRQRGFQPRVHFAWRSVAVQLQLFRQGNTTVKFSFHNAQKRDGTPNAYAADIIDSRYAWTAAAESSGFWAALGEEGKAQGLYWGGDWTSFKDLAHVQYYPNSSLRDVKAESGL
jgi:peptidoglycan L-alanyl-D-glutamate endopeptidase CwlK